MKLLLQPREELNPSQPTQFNRSRDQVLGFCTSLYDTICGEFLVQLLQAHSIFIGTDWLELTIEKRAQWRNRRVGMGTEYPPETFDREISADLRGKKEKKGEN